jgi:hypothetical protein
MATFVYLGTTVSNQIEVALMINSDEKISQNSHVSDKVMGRITLR